MKIERLLIILPAMVGIFILVGLISHINLTQKQLETHHTKLAEHALSDAQHQMENLLREYRRAVIIYVSGALPLIQRIYDNADDDEAVTKIKEQLNQYFPLQVAYTITKENGERLVDPFMESVGKICQRDIESSLQTGTYPIFTHPGPTETHIDIIVPWQTSNGSSGAFLVSFKPDILSNILQRTQPEGHNLYLIRSDTGNLIEVSANGIRANLQRDVLLSANEKNSIIANINLAGTLWTLADILDDDLISKDFNAHILDAIFFMGLYIIIASILTVLGFREIKHKKQVEQALLKAKLSAEQANSAKSLFVSNMSHELRTPLNSILGFSQMLGMDESLTQDQRDDLKIIYDSGNHLLELINEILDISRIEAGRIDLSITAVPVLNILLECKTMIKPLLAEYNIHLQDFDPNCQDIVVSADYARLKQVLLNFLSNACKYNQQGGNIKVSCETHGGTARIMVKDTGDGLSQEQQGKLFSSFERLGAENSHIQGTGIGLVIAKQLTELMHGEIGVDSTPGDGSTFWIKLNLFNSSNTETD